MNTLIKYQKNTNKHCNKTGNKLSQSTTEFHNQQTVLELLLRKKYITVCIFAKQCAKRDCRNIFVIEMPEVSMSLTEITHFSEKIFLN